MRASTRYIVNGKYHEVKGSFRNLLGNSVSSRRLALSGQVERIGGIMQWRFGRIGRAFGL